MRSSGESWCVDVYQSVNPTITHQFYWITIVDINSYPFISQVAKTRGATAMKRVRRKTKSYRNPSFNFGD